MLRSNTDRSALAEALAYRAYLKYRQGEFKEASLYAQESLTLNQASGDQIGIVFCLITLSFISLAHSKAIDRAERLRAELVAQLTPQQIETLRNRVQTRNLESLGEEVLASGSTRTTASPLSR